MKYTIKNTQEKLLLFRKTNDINSLKKYIFKFHNLDSMKYKFELLDYFSHLNLFKIHTFNIYLDINKELRKRNIILLKSEYNSLFFHNILLLKDFFETFYTINNENILYLAEDNAHKYNIKTKNTTVIKLRNFKNKAILEQFNFIFDAMMINYKFINKNKYDNFMKSNRKELYNIDYESKNLIFFSTKHLKEFRNNLLKSTYKLQLKKFASVKKVNIFVDDIEFDKFKIIFNMLSCIFKNKKYSLNIKTDLKEFERVANNQVNIFVSQRNENIDTSLWTNKDKYILTYDNLVNDMKYIFNKNIDIYIKLINNKNKSISEKRIIYNSNYYVFKRVDKFINHFKEGGYGSN